MLPLEERLENLKLLRNQEYQSAEPSQKYLDDLELSIKFCEKQLKKKGKKPYEMVSG